MLCPARWLATRRRHACSESRFGDGRGAGLEGRQQLPWTCQLANTTSFREEKLAPLSFDRVGPVASVIRSDLVGWNVFRRAYQWRSMLLEEQRRCFFLNGFSSGG